VGESNKVKLTPAWLKEIRKDDAGWSDGYCNASPKDIIAQRRALIGEIDALQSQLARETQRLASLTQQRDVMHKALAFYANCDLIGFDNDHGRIARAALTPAQEAQT
jgi:hypothetical protein